MTFRQKVIMKDRIMVFLNIIRINGVIIIKKPDNKRIYFVWKKAIIATTQTYIYALTWGYEKHIL